jgi:hypothetical protein
MHDILPSVKKGICDLRGKKYWLSNTFKEQNYFLIKDNLIGKHAYKFFWV